MSTAPRKVQAYAAYEAGLHVKPYEYVSRPLGAGDVEIQISHCGICGSDLHTISGGWGDAKWPVVAGHEIVGTITAVGPDVKELALGDRVGVGAMVFACLDKATCNECANDDDPLCSRMVLTYNGTYEDGATSQGGYADYVRVSADYAFKIPSAIPSDVAAPLLCAGVTVYTPLKEYVKPGMRVGIVGIGGLGHLALQFAKALGATPVAFSHSPNKEKEARALGAVDFVVIGSADTSKQTSLNDTSSVSTELLVDVLLVTADADDQPYDLYISYIKKCGKLVMVGAPNKKMEISAFSLIMSKVTVVGSAVGGIKDTKDMLQLAAEKKVFPWIQKLPMSSVNEGIALVDQGKPRFRVVLEN